MGQEDGILLLADPPEIQAERREILQACRAECDRNPDCGDDDLCTRCRGELILEAAVNSRLAFRALRTQGLVIRRLQVDRNVLYGIALTIVAVGIPIASAVLGRGA